MIVANKIISQLKINIALMAILTVFGINCLAEAAKSDDVVQSALDAVLQKTATQAIPILENAEKNYPFHNANIEVLFQLANAYMNVDRYKDALAAYDIFLQRYGRYEDEVPSIDEVRVMRGKAISKLGREDEGIEVIKAFLERREDSKSRDLGNVELASIYVTQEKYDEATKLLNGVARKIKSPMRDAAMFLLTEISIKKGDESQTEVLMKNLVKNAKTKAVRINALFKLGEIYRDSSNFVQAIDAYRRIKASGSGAEAQELNSGILYEIGTTYENLGHPLEARIAFERIAEAYSSMPISTAAWHRSIMSYVDFEDFDRAEKKYLAYIKKHPNLVIAEDLRLYMAQKLLQKDNFNQAIYNLQEGVKEFPNGSYAEISYHSLGVSLLGAKRYKEAKKSLESFAASFPESPLVPESYEYLAEGYIQQSQYQTAIDTLKSLIAKFPDSASGTASVRRIDETFLMYGDFLVSTNEIDQGIAQYRKVTFPELQEQALMLEIEVLLENARFDDAVVSCQKFIDTYPQSELLANTYLNMGSAQMQLEDYLAAEKSLDKIAELDSENAAAVVPISKLQKAFCRYYLNDQVGMSNVLGEIVQGYPGTSEAGEALYWIGYIHRANGAYLVATDVYSKLADTYSTHDYAPEASYLAGECFVPMNDYDSAGQRFIQSFEKFPKAGYGLYSLVRAGGVYAQNGMATNWIGTLNKLKADGNPEGNTIDIAIAATQLSAGMKVEALKTIKTINFQDLEAGNLGIAYAIKAGIERMDGKLRQAEKAGQQAVAICLENNVGQDLALYELGAALLAQKKWAEAAEVYAELTGDITIPDQKTQGKALVDLANCLLEIEEYDQIVEICDKAIRMRPAPEQAARAVLIKGDSKFKQEDYTQAAQYYKRATILYDGFDDYIIPAYKGLIESYKKLGLSEDVQATEKDFKEYVPATKRI